LLWKPSQSDGWSWIAQVVIVSGRPLIGVLTALTALVHGRSHRHPTTSRRAAHCGGEDLEAVPFA
jgi:hypothetical protein